MLVSAILTDTFPLSVDTYLAPATTLFAPTLTPSMLADTTATAFRALAPTLVMLALSYVLTYALRLRYDAFWQIVHGCI